MTNATKVLLLEEFERVTSSGLPVEALCELVRRLQGHIDTNGTLQMSAMLHDIDERRLTRLFGRARMMVGGRLSVSSSIDQAWSLFGRQNWEEKARFIEAACELIAFTDSILNDDDVRLKDKLQLDFNLMQWAFDNFKKMIFERHRTNANCINWNSLTKAMFTPRAIVDRKFNGILDIDETTFRAKVRVDLGLQKRIEDTTTDGYEWIPEWQENDDTGGPQLEADNDPPPRRRYDEVLEKRKRKDNVVPLRSVNRPRMPKRGE